VARLHVLAVAALLSAVCFHAAEQVYGQGQGVFLPNQEVRVTGLPSLTALSRKSSAVLATALEIILHDKAVCCGKYSALEDAALSEPRSLEELRAKLQGQRRLSDGSSIMVNAEYVPESSVTADLIIRTLAKQQALLIEWRSHFYVLYGAIFNENRDVYSGIRQFFIVKLLLLDPRFSDQRREVVFNRETDDPAKVQGILTLTVARQ
jgi:hypothetical protein